MSIMNKIHSILKVTKSPALTITIDEDCKSNLLFFWVKIEGKCTPPLKRDPVDLLKECYGKNSFSKGDHNRIISTMLENQKRIIDSKYKKGFSLIKHQFSHQLEEPLIVFSDSTRQIHIKTAKEIYSNIKNLKRFSSEDSACIGYIIGCHETQKEIAYRNKNSETNVINFDISLASG